MNRNKMNLQQKKTHVRVFQEFLIIASFTKLNCSQRARSVIRSQPLKQDMERGYYYPSRNRVANV